MGYKKLLWGFIFLFDLRIMGFDILPDFIGYIFFYQGLSVLEAKNTFFSKGKGLALPMIILSFFDIYQVSGPINDNSMGSLGIFSIIYGLITVGINLLMVYNICFGIKTEAQKIEHLDLESKAGTAWNLYLISNILIAASFILIGLLQFLFIIVFAVSIISYILMLNLTHSASNQLD